jgi:hypothetical protein
MTRLVPNLVVDRKQASKNIITFFDPASKTPYPINMSSKAKPTNVEQVSVLYSPSGARILNQPTVMTAVNDETKFINLIVQSPQQ